MSASQSNNIHDAGGLPSRNPVAPPTLRFFSDVPDPFVSHALKWLGFTLNSRIVRLSPASPETRCDADLVYGGGPDGVRGVHVPCDSSPGALPAPMPTVTGGPPYRLPFDFFTELRAWMTDQRHASAPEEAFDAHGRLKFNQSIFPGMGTTLAEPVVNRHVMALRDLLTRSTGRASSPLWPDGRRACVILSHDVDAPLNPGALGSALNMAGARRRAGQPGGAAYLLMSTAYQRLKLLSRGRLRPFRQWYFDEIMADEARHGFRSTFYFASRHRWDAGAHRQRDVGYDLRTRRFRGVFDRLRASGFETGLHASYNVINGGLLDEELARLRHASGCDVTGVRHHFWRLGRPPLTGLRLHEQAGLLHDSSLAFNDGLGWRMGIGLPYWPWDTDARRGINVLQIPPMLMDGALWYEPIGMERALSRVNDLLDTLVRHEAVGAIDWHACTSHPGDNEFHEWGLCYQEILKLLAGRKDIWVTTSEGVYRHWMSRAALHAPTAP